MWRETLTQLVEIQYLTLGVYWIEDHVPELYEGNALCIKDSDSKAGATKNTWNNVFFFLKKRF